MANHTKRIGKNPEGPIYTPLSILTSDNANSSLILSASSSVGNWVGWFFFSWYCNESIRVTNSPVEGATPNKSLKLNSKMLEVSQAGGPMYTLESSYISGVVAQSKALSQSKAFARWYLGFCGLPRIVNLASISRAWFWLSVTVATIRQARRFHRQVPAPAWEGRWAILLTLPSHTRQGCSCSRSPEIEPMSEKPIMDEIY